MIRTVITVAIPCQECGEVARLEMSPEQALQHASDVVAAAEGLEPVEVVVRGEG